MTQVFCVPFTGQEIGQGYNSQTREALGTALLVADTSEDREADGQEVFTMFESVTTQEALNKTLGISATADARYGLFSGGAKFDFAESHAVNSFSSHIAGRCIVRNAMRHGHGFKLNDEAAPLVRAQQIDDFKLAFGDMFVRALKTGGEVIIVARITSVSETHQSQMSASLHAEYNSAPLSVSFKSAFQTAMAETHNQSEVMVWMSQAGGIGGQNTFTGLDAVKILQRLSEFPAIVHDHPVGYEAEVANYNTIPLPVPPAEEREDREIVLRDCLAQKMGFLKALSDLDFLMGENAELFFEALPSNEELQKFKRQYQDALNALMAHAILVSKGKMEPPQMFIANPAPPLLRFKKKPFAPPAGNSFAARGRALCEEDPLAQALRELQPAGTLRDVFDDTMGRIEGQTDQGPGKQAFREALNPSDRSAFDAAVLFTLDRNKANKRPLSGDSGPPGEWARKGAAIAKADAVAAAARNGEKGISGIFFALGFDIGAAIFSPTNGGAGHTSEGPGSQRVRDELLSQDAQRGFRAAVDLYLVQKHKG
jgi:hypothetical protein